MMKKAVKVQNTLIVSVPLCQTKCVVVVIVAANVPVEKVSIALNTMTIALVRKKQ